MTRPVIGAAVLCALLSSAGRVLAQQEVPGRLEAVAPARWVYPRLDRRDPLVPPGALYSAKERPELMVSLIMYDGADPGASRALVRLEGEEPIREVVRAGSEIGDYRIARIDRACVVVVVQSLGAQREATMCLGRGNPGKVLRDPSP